MEKLELKHIAAYLPYNLNFIDKKGNILRMDALRVRDYNVWAYQRYVNGEKDKNDINYPHLSSLKCTGEGNLLKKIKPILRPMIDLTNSIIVKGYNNNKPFVPLIDMAKYDMGNEGNKYELKRDLDPYIASYYVKVTIDGYNDPFFYNFNIDVRYTHANLWELDFLNQWNFDYRGLINKGLAIDINKLNNNKS